ncbi:MAG: hypothetical protein V2B14_04995 [bacterium]
MNENKQSSLSVGSKISDNRLINNFNNAKPKTNDNKASGMSDTYKKESLEDTFSKSKTPGNENQNQNTAARFRILNMTDIANLLDKIKNNLTQGTPGEILRNFTGRSSALIDGSNFVKFNNTDNNNTLVKEDASINFRGLNSSISGSSDKKNSGEQYPEGNKKEDKENENPKEADFEDKRDQLEATLNSLALLNTLKVNKIKI